jgi:hypothetical protein
MESLYDLADEYKAALAVMHDSDIDEQTIIDTLEGLTGAIEAKGRNVAAFFLNLDSNAAQLKEAELRIAKRRKSIENKAAKLREYLRLNMTKCEITEISCPEFSVKLGKASQVVEVENESALPATLVTTTITTKPDKREILKRLKTGEIIEGARLAFGVPRLTIK